MTKTKVQPMDDADFQDLCLPAKENQEWLQAICTDDQKEVERILAQSTPEEKNRYLNGYFGFEDSPLPLTACPLECARPKFTFSHAWHMAVAFGSRDVVRSFIQHGCQVLMVDSKGMNAIHCLIHMNFMREDLEEDMLETFKVIDEQVSESDMRELIHQEETECGLRPVELALHLGVCQLADVLLGSEKGNGPVIKMHGTSCTFWIDVTDYETNTKRKYKSPFFLFAMFDRHRIDNKHFQELFFSDVTQHWLEAKSKMLRVFVFLWFVFRTLFVVAYYISDGALIHLEEQYIQQMANPIVNGTVNMTESCIGSTYGTYDMGKGNCIFIGFCYFHCILQLVYDRVENCFLFQDRRAKWLDWTPKGRKKSIVHIEFYREVQFALYIFVIANLTCRMYRLCTTYQISFLFDHITYTLITFALIWSLLQFTQFLPGIGHFTVVMQRLLGNLTAFSAVFLLFNFFFALMFWRVVNQGHVQCTDQFPVSSSGQTVYSTFLVLTHMLDFRHISVQDEFTVYFLHAAYVFLMSILMINFLIAMFSNTVHWVSNHRQVIVTVQRLVMLKIVEHRLTFIPLIGKYYSGTSLVTLRRRTVESTSTLTSTSGGDAVDAELDQGLGGSNNNDKDHGTKNGIRG